MGSKENHEHVRMRKREDGQESKDMVSELVRLVLDVSVLLLSNNEATHLRSFASSVSEIQA